MGEKSLSSKMNTVSFCHSINQLIFFDDIRKQCKSEQVRVYLHSGTIKISEVDSKFKFWDEASL